MGLSLCVLTHSSSFGGQTQGFQASTLLWKSYISILKEKIVSQLLLQFFKSSKCMFMVCFIIFPVTTVSDCSSFVCWRKWLSRIWRLQSRGCCDVQRHTFVHFLTVAYTRYMLLSFLCYRGYSLPFYPSHPSYCKLLIQQCCTIYVLRC